MGVILELLKEVPLSAVLKERISELESKMAVLEAQNMVLKGENADLHTRLQSIETEQDIQEDTCPYCRQPNSELLRIAPHETFGIVGIKVAYYKCPQCGKEYDREQKP